MKAQVLMLAAALSFAACEESHVGDRFRAERDLWRVDAQSRRIGSSPRAWRQVAARYEDVAQRQLNLLETSDLPREDILDIAARARINAARAFAAGLDSLRAMAVLDEIMDAYAALPEVVGQAARLRGQMAEAQGDHTDAVAFYERFLELSSPDLGRNRDAGAILNLPLHMARLASRGRETPDAARYATARTYYETVADTASRDVALEARHLLAQLAVDLGEWNEAVRILQQLEEEVLQESSPAIHPMLIRLERVENQMTAMAWGRADSIAVREALDSFMHDYPGKPIVARAILARAQAYADLGSVTNALRDFDRILTDYPQSEVAAEAGWQRARLLEKAGRWKEAYRGLRSLEVEWPLSDQGLQVPLELARHHRREGDPVAFADALNRAERAYGDFMERYPPGPHTYVARQRLVETMLLAGEHAKAADTMLAYAREYSGSSRELRLLAEAARTLYVDGGDTARALVVLDQAAQGYPGTRLGVWSAREADRLRQTTSP